MAKYGQEYGVLFFDSQVVVHFLCFFGLMYCVIVCLFPALHTMFHILMARYNLFVLDVLVNSNCSPVWAPGL